VTTAARPPRGRGLGATTRLTGRRPLEIPTLTLSDPLWCRLVRRFWLPVEMAAVRAHMGGLTWQGWGWVAGLLFDVPAILYVYPDASPEWVLGLRLLGVPLQPLAARFARRTEARDEAVLAVSFGYALVINALMALQGVALGGWESPWVLGVLAFTSAGSLVADVRPARIVQTAVLWFAVWVAVLGVASGRVPAVAAQLASPRGPLVFLGHWCFVAAVLGASIHFGLQIDSLRRELTLARRLARYRLQVRLGVGGMNEVWLAWDDDARRNVALKILRRDSSADAVRRLEREAQALRSLRSEHTVRIYDIGASNDGVMFIAMEHLDGADLDRVVKAYGPLPPGRAVALVAQACDALAEAHAQGIVHRDVKPSNLFLVRRSRGGDHLKVLDFGIARRIHGDESRLTMDGDTMGTPHFMAPESYLGRAPDPRVDVWGLGATLYFLLTARRPFEGYTGDALTAAVVATAVEPPSRYAPGPVPAALDAVVLRALSRDREARFARVEDLALALAEIAATLPLGGPAGAILDDERMSVRATAAARALVASEVDTLPARAVGGER
jgi:hypothetical protein